MREYLGKPFTTQELWACLLKFLKTQKVEDPGDTQEESGKEEGIVTDGAGVVIIDYARGLKMSSGNRTLYEKLKKDFVKNYSALLDELEKAVQAGDITLAHRMAHTVKGVSALIGADKLREAAYAIELSLSKGKAEYSDEQLGYFGGALEELINTLGASAEEAVTAAQNGGPKEFGTPTEIEGRGSPLDKDKAIALLDKLEPLLKAGDIASLDLAAEAREPFPDLAVLIEDYEFEKACEAVAEIRKKLET
jgi:HPt (histidine-containing phosphotransfer) domain-containing protein